MVKVILTGIARGLLDYKYREWRGMKLTAKELCIMKEWDNWLYANKRVFYYEIKARVAIWEECWKDGIMTEWEEIDWPEKKLGF